MILRILVNTSNISINNQTVRVVRLYDRNVPSGINESIITEKGSLIVGSEEGAVGELPPGSTGQYLTPDPGSALGLKYVTPSIAIADSTNYLINTQFLLAGRLSAPGTLTAIADNSYSADRWKVSRENTSIQYQRNDATSEVGLTSSYYARYKKITNAGKIMIGQVVESINAIPMRGKNVIFQMKMRASSSKTIKMAIVELQNAGSANVIPNFVSAWGADGVNPTLGSNLAVITGAESKSVTTEWQNFSVSVVVPGDSNNIIVMIWSDSDFSANDYIDLAEAGLYQGNSTVAWIERPFELEVALCYRYCVSFRVYAVNGTGQTIVLPVPMRVTPSLTVTADSGTGAAYTALSGFSLYQSSANSVASPATIIADSDL